MRREGLARGGIFTLLGSGFAAVAALLVTVVIGHTLGAAGTGVFFQALGIFTVLTQVLRLGTNTGIVRFISEQRAFDRIGSEWRIVCFAAIPVAALSGLASLAVWFGADALASWLSEPGDSALGADVLRSMAPFVFVGAVLGVVEISARMLRGAGTFALLQNVMLPASRLLAVSIVALAGATAYRAFEAWLIPLPVWLIVGLAVIASPLIRDFRRRSDSPTESRPRFRMFWRFNVPRAISSALEVALEWADVLIVAALAPPAVAGVYAVVTRVVKVGGIVDHAMRIAVAPTISAMLARRETHLASSLHTDVVRVLILLSWPFYVLIIAMGGSVLAIFGPEFVVGWGPMVLLALSLMFQTACGMLQSVLIQGGKSAWQMYNKAIAVGLSIVGNIMLVPVMGIWGAAVTWLVVALADNLIAAYQVHRLMGVHLKPVSLFPAMVPPVLVFGVGGALISLLAGSSLISLLVGGLILAPIYAIVLWGARRQLQIVALWRKVPLIGPRA